MERRGLTPLERRLRSEFTAVLKARDAVAVSAFRSALAAVDNAGSVAQPAGPIRSEAEIREIMGREIRDRESAALELDGLGRTDNAERLRAEASVLSAFLSA